MNLFGRVTRLLIPAPCLLCGQTLSQGSNLCAACIRDLPRPSHRCPVCALAVNGAQQRCGQCLTHPPAFSAARAGLDYDAAVRLLIHRLKFSGDTSVLDDLIAPLLEAIGPEQGRPDAIVPVPLHPARRRQRGFNQARLIANRLGKALSVPVLGTCVRRNRTGAPQSRLSARARRNRLRAAFEVTAPLPPRVAIVDDVMTTGGTAESLATSLLRGGAEDVVVWVLARTPAPD